MKGGARKLGFGGRALTAVLALVGLVVAGGCSSPSEEETGGDQAASTQACGAVEFPSGVKLISTPDAAMTAQYTALHGHCAVPKCFFDLNNLKDADGNVYSADTALKIKVSEHFTLDDFVGKDTKVVLNPKLVQLMEKTRQFHGDSPIPITSGYRSPQHQHDICHSVCGHDQCVQHGKTTCAKLSRHMWGAAVDMDLRFESAARKAGFPFVFHENGGTGPHLHVDLQQCN